MDKTTVMIQQKWFNNNVKEEGKEIAKDGAKNNKNHLSMKARHVKVSIQ